MGYSEYNGVGKSGSKADLLKKVKAFGYYVKAAAPMTGIALSVILSDSAIAVIPNEVAQLYLQEKVDKLDYLFFLCRTWFNSIGKKEEKGAYNSFRRACNSADYDPSQIHWCFYSNACGSVSECSPDSDPNWPKRKGKLLFVGQVS